MNVATIGFDNELQELMRWVKQSPNYRLEACFDLPNSSEAVELAGTAATDESWEVLLSKTVADVVLVAARPRHAQDPERRNEQLRKLVQAALPLILVHPTCEMLMGLELEMIRQDSQGVMIPYHAGLWDWRYQQLAGVVHHDPSVGEPLGKVEQLVWERRASDRDDESVMKHFARDAMMLRDLMANVTNVSATGAIEADDRYANLSVSLTDPSSLIARWSILPAQDDHEGAQLTVIGSSGSAVLQMPESGSYSLSGGFTPQKPTESRHPAEDVFQQLQSLLTEKTSAAESPWDASCRTLEIEDAAERSCRRRRTIELFHEKVTERETFKSMMAAGGCGMLMWVLLMLLVAGIVEGLKLPIRESTFWRLWSVVLFTPLGIFLLLQLLLSRETPREE